MPRPRMSDEEYAEYMDFVKMGGMDAYRKGVVVGDEPVKLKEKDEPKPFVLSAWNYDTGKMMDIEDYCVHYNLPKDDILEYKLVTHTGTPYYNTRFKEGVSELADLTNEFIEQAIQKHIKPVLLTQSHGRGKESSEWFDRLIYTDTHIGMDTNKEGIAMYATPWNKEEQMRRVKVMVNELVANKTSNTLYIDELGDFMDGWNGFTTRGGHELPQNMSTEDAYDAGLDFKMFLVDAIVPHYEVVILNNICNDNHAGAFGYTVNSAVKRICEVKYPTRVTINNYRQFLNNYVVGKHAFVTTHGKDSKSLKFGFKPQLDAVQVKKIDGYLKENKLYQRSDFIEFSKGDSHQMLLDYCTSDDFTYFNYPAFSPSSEWVQNNYQKGRSGFVIQNVRYNTNEKNIIPKWF